MHIRFLYFMGIVAVGCLTVIKAESVPYFDGPYELSGLKLIEYLDEMLLRVADGAESSYMYIKEGNLLNWIYIFFQYFRSGKVTSVTSQVVSGVLYLYTV